MSHEQPKDHVVDRTGWPAGEWDTEPDREEWRAHGFPCLIVRNHMGGLCGYVGVPPGHPVHGKDLAASDDDGPSLSVHGGVTYAAACAGAICHVPQEGEPADVWWIGFDCGHAFDLQPGFEAQMAVLRRMRAIPEMPRGFRNTYRSIGYVRAEVEDLAEQLRALAEPPRLRSKVRRGDP